MPARPRAGLPVTSGPAMWRDWPPRKSQALSSRFSPSLGSARAAGRSAGPGAAAAVGGRPLSARAAASAGSRVVRRAWPVSGVHPAAAFGVSWGRRATVTAVKRPCGPSGQGQGACSCALQNLDVPLKPALPGAPGRASLRPCATRRPRAAPSGFHSASGVRAERLLSAEPRPGHPASPPCWPRPLHEGCVTSSHPRVATSLTHVKDNKYFNHRIL